MAVNLAPISTSRIPATRRHRWAATRRLTANGWEVAYGRTRRRAVANLIHHRQR